MIPEASEQSIRRQHQRSRSIRVSGSVEEFLNHVAHGRSSTVIQDERGRCEGAAILAGSYSSPNAIAQ
jgi:hypothetical protein